MGFDLSKYQTVKQRKDLFSTEHPTGVILACPMKVDGEEATFTVGAWETSEAYVKGLEALQAVLSSGAQISDLQALLVMGPDGLGTAYEAKWMTGASRTSWTENAEESAIGRCLDNVGYHGDGKCSREEIEKAQRAEAAMKENAIKVGAWMTACSDASSSTLDKFGKWWPKNKEQIKTECGEEGAAEVYSQFSTYYNRLKAEANDSA